MAGADEAISKLRAALLKAKCGHYHCDDSWYSCPKAPEGCSDHEKGTDCDCGADKFNAEIDTILRETEEWARP